MLFVIGLTRIQDGGKIPIGSHYNVALFQMSSRAISSFLSSQGTLQHSHFELLMSLRHSYSTVKLSQSHSTNLDSACVNFYIFQHGGQLEIFVKDNIGFSSHTGELCIVYA